MPVIGNLLHITDRSAPFFNNIPLSQLDDSDQSHIRSNGAFALSYLLQSPVKSFNSIGRVDHSPNGLIILEIECQPVPVSTPRAR